MTVCPDMLTLTVCISKVNSVLTSLLLMLFACYNPDKITLGHIETVVPSCFMVWTHLQNKRMNTLINCAFMVLYQCLAAFTTCLCLGGYC